ncbi:hypothetical protein Tco_0952411 [Tanacetum coccineum]|uniref:Uncharacterized protein n=1 Tax=Tanacetum coccineum TaxID=301880 RepID=A0ABQ5DZR9_9ASTR
MSASMEARIAEHAAAPTPPLPVASSPLPLPSPLTTSPTDAGAPLGYRAAGIRMRAADASPPLSLPPTSPRTDIPEAEMPPRKRACLTTPAPGYEIGESSAAGAARQPGPTPAVDTWERLPSLPLKSPVYHEPSVASVVSASVVDRSIGTDNPHLSLGSQADSWCIEHLRYYFLGCLAEHPTFVGHSNLLIEVIILLDEHWEHSRRVDINKTQGLSFLHIR